MTYEDTPIYLLIIAAIVVVIGLFIKSRQFKKLNQLLSIPGKKMTIMYDCMVTQKIRIDESSGISFFKGELINRGFTFDHVKIKDLGYTWIDKDNKKGFNKYEIEYWSWE